MSTTILVIGDPHFKINNVKQTELMAQAIINLAKEKSLDFIVVLGDVLDRHESIHISPLHRAVHFLSQLTNIAPTYLLMGNHDLKNNKQFLSEEHPFTALKQWSNCVVVDKPIKHNNFVFTPYVSPGRFIEALDFLDDWKTATCIFAHQEFRGCQMGHLLSTEGDEWCDDYPLVISGHIHDYQKLSNVLYVGSPMQHAFGDRSDKTVSVFTFSENTMTHDRIDLNLPKKQIVHITSEQVNDYVLPQHGEIKIIISGVESSRRTIMNHPSVNSWRKLGFCVMYNVIDNVNTQTLNQNVLPILPSYSQSLYDIVSDKPNLCSLYEQFFGKVPKKLDEHNHGNSKQRVVIRMINS